MVSGMKRSQRNALQIRAFKSVYRQLIRIGDKSIEECFVEAICATSDKAFAAIKEPKLVEGWANKYSKARPKGDTK